MGYRNDVAIECGSKAYELLSKAIKETGFQPNEVYENGKEHTYVLSWDCVKWNNSFDKAFNELDGLSEYNRDGDGLGNKYPYEYRFVRYGEEYSDREERGSEYANELFPMNVIDTITIDNSNLKGVRNFG